jgi:small ligand-binding sensory domain FIST
MPPKKEFSCAYSNDKDWAKAVKTAAGKVREGLHGEVDLALLFVSESYPALKAEALTGLVGEVLACRLLIGCNASGVITREREIEMEPAISILGMRLPDVKLVPFYISPGHSQSLQGPSGLVEVLDIYPSDKPKFLVFADPMSCDVEKCLGLFNEAYPGVPVIGGLASGPASGRPNWLILGDEVYKDGLVGVALSGDVEFEIVVAQGCRPIGEPLIITKASGNILLELGGRSPLQVLRELISGLTPEDKGLARNSLFAGIVMDEYRTRFQRGDFLIRNLMGFDSKTGALMVGANLRAGQHLQFQLRDARTSAEDLEALLGPLKPSGVVPAGGLLVSCCGRGKGLYGKPDHDSCLIQSLKGPLPLAGFFANGEIGPVGGKNYLHGYTSSLAVIR